MNKKEIRNYSNYLIIGFCPLLAISSKVTASIIGGIVFFLVSILTILTMRLIYNFIEEKKGYENFIIIIAVFYLCFIRLILYAIGLDIVGKMGIYFSLIGVNAYILFLYEQNINKNVIDKLPNILSKTGLYVLLLIAFSIIREILGTGKLDLVFRFGENKIGSVINISKIFILFSPIGEHIEYGLPLFILPSGGLILLGIAIGVYQHFKFKKHTKTEEESN
jgi:Na+-translocating ferredoxin:NAD+ oxidoreductase subunit E